MGRQARGEGSHRLPARPYAAVGSTVAPSTCDEGEGLRRGICVITGQGHWDFLDRAIDRDGHLIDARLRDTRDLAAAEAFLRSAWTVTGVAPDRISTDGHDAEPRAMRTVFGARVMHHPTCDLTNARERAHRGMKPR